jgi:uncharacterized protein (TIGR03437 family)
LPEADPRVWFGGLPLPPENILYIGSAPGAAGLYQLNMIVPSTPGVGDKGVVLRVFGKLSLVGTTVPVDRP